jgi:hypothetical protein
MKRPVVLVVVAGLTLLGVVPIMGAAQAKVRGPNGLIAFARQDPDVR